MKNEEQPKVQEQGNLDVESQSNSAIPDSPMIDEEWLNLTKDWQAQPFEKTDMNALVKKTKRRTYAAKSLLVLDVIATFGLFIMFIYGFFAEQWSTATQIFLFCSGIGSIIYVYYEFQIRLNTWQQNCGTPDKAVKHAIASCESSIKYIKLIKFWFWIMLPGINWYLYAMMNVSEKSPWAPFIFGNSLIVITWLITHVFHKKRLKELKELSQI